MKILEVFEKITDYVFLALDVFCRMVLIFMTGIVFLQVMLRTFFKTNIPWGEEMVLLTMVWMTFGAMSIGIKGEAHIRIDFFMARFPEGVRKAVVHIDNIILLLVNIAMIYYGCQLIQFTKISLMPVTKLPSSAVFYLIPVAAFTSVMALLGKLLGLYETRGTRNFVSGVYEEEVLKGDEEE